MAKTKIKKTILKEVKPLFTKIICTADRFTEEESYNSSGLLDATKIGAVKELQEVVSSSTYAENQGIHKGDTVILSFNRYAVYKQKQTNSLKNDFDEEFKKQLKHELPFISINSSDFLLLDTSDVVLIVNDLEIVEESTKSDLITL